MTAIVSALSHATGTHVEVDKLRTVLIFCGAGLTVSLLLASYRSGFEHGVFQAFEART
jgi:hypothetical protein